LVKNRIREQCRGICREYHSSLVLTRGGETIWCARDDQFAEIPVKAIKPVNTIGSGDAFTAGLALALDGGADLPSAVAEGARCGARNAALMKPGSIR
jgi:1-phosphofructokinase/tagatose 6-phosphate kinase